MAGKVASMEGGCFCGSVRYRINGKTTYAGNCHCRDCQRAIGAGMITWFGVEPDDLEISRGVLTFCETSPGIRRGFCGACGTSLTFGGKGWDEIGVTAASLDDPSLVSPSSNVYLDHRQPWVVHDESLRNYDKFPEGVGT